MTVRIDKYDALGNDFLVLDLAQVASHVGSQVAGASAGASAASHGLDWSAVARAW